ncbi:sodium-dependent bicarbonate transport family permease [Alsobacter metallidurans]|uniref:Sodium-dependent bicarbonate transport family permease n=1 Tax=Alsobacter metallidurans TaxID=340221 RepID=A0A917I811_9HYPH|nr:sodium-dependent bicarbonate transport family permease [Alsobacter metallidurans]GGH21391.1 sodium-dependent bicarbonate transport family permease [Alsobacter metallidurans]
MGALDLAVGNLLSPVVLFFALGVGAALARSDLSFPEAVAKALAIYLMMAIGLKGGVEVSRQGLQPQLIWTVLAGAALSFLIPALAYGVLRLISRLGAVDAAAVAAHYGSISAVTFAAALDALSRAGLGSEGYMVAVAAVMETPAIMAALLIARRAAPEAATGSVGHLLREAGLNGSVVVLVGSFVVGWIAGPAGVKPIAPLFVDLFRGLLCLFLLDMGLVAGRGLSRARRFLTAPLILFGIGMPLISAAIATAIALGLGLSTGGAMLFITLAASASYIAAPAAMRIALPQAEPAIYLTLSLGVTFPFNLAIGLPLYLLLARSVSP